MIVEEMRKRFSMSADVAIIYVYCQYDEPETLNSSSIVRSLIKQILFHLEAMGKPDITIQDKLNKAHRQSRCHLGAEEGIEMLLSLLRKFSKVFIMIDGLDECHSVKGHDTLDEATKLLRYLKRLLAVPTTVTAKLFLSSRFEVDVRRWIPSCVHVSLSQSNVQVDIKSFVEEEVEDKIWAAGRIEDYNLMQEIKEKLVLEAQGM